MRASFLLVCLVAVPALAQAPPTQSWPSTRPADQPAPAAKPTEAPPKPAAAAPVPLPLWFVEIDTAKSGSVTRAQFLQYRMKFFDQLDADKDGKLSLEEFLKIAEPPFATDLPNGPNLEERRNRARSEFQNLDTDRDGFVARAEAEALIHAEFSRYDTDRDNKISEPEIRLIVQRSMAREAAERQQAEQRRRQGMTGLNDFIDLQLREADQLDKNNDGKVSQQEYVALAGPADGEQAKGLLPYDIRRQLVLRRFQEIDTNMDGQLDRVELTAYALKLFREIDSNKDRFLSEQEMKVAQETEAAKLQTIIPTLTKPAAAAAPAAPRPAPMPPAPAPGLPQRTR
jgi:Ca2+-binding EF-hand superfamily protein